MGGVWNDPTYQEWSEHVQKNVVPMIEESAVTVSLVPTGESDIKFAVELGLSIMMDKPIIALVSPGTKIPEALARVADELVEVDIKENPEAAQRSIKAAFGRVMQARSGLVDLDDTEVDRNER